MNEKKVVITGANSGIGLATACTLAARGAEVIALCRSRERSAAAMAEISDSASNTPPRLVEADLSDMSSIRRAAEEVLALYPEIDVLINNAGIMLPQRQISVDGYEMQFATNHLGHFLLTGLLLPSITASRQGRIINLSSGAHFAGKMNFKDLMLEKGYRPFKAYGQSKLANILFTRSLAKKLEESTVTVNAVHPGLVATNFATDRNSNKQAGFMKLMGMVAKTPAQGAETSIHLASSPDLHGVSGEYFANSKPAATSKASKDMKSADRLWQLSQSLTGITYP